MFRSGAYGLLGNAHIEDFENFSNEVDKLELSVCQQLRGMYTILVTELLSSISRNFLKRTNDNFP